MNAVESSVWDFVNRHFDPSDVRRRGSQIMLRECPFCNGGEGRDEWTFGIGLDNGAYNCLRANECNVKGSFKQLLSYFGEKPIDRNLAHIKNLKTANIKKYTKPEPDKLKPITDEIISYMGTRGISEETLKDWKIASDGQGNIVFPFYRDNVLTFVKYRKPKKFEKVLKDWEDWIATLPEKDRKKHNRPSKEWTCGDAEPILFGMDMVSYNRPLVITEGEIDALSLYEAGVTNVVSVPMGCKNLEWINLCYDWLDNFSQIVLFGDSDDAGTVMISTLCKRLGDDRCMVPGEYPACIYHGQDLGRICKDANEILLCYGPEYLKEMVDSCELEPVKGVLNLASIQYQDPTLKPKILTKIPQLDYDIGGLMFGGVSVFSGKRSEGKSTIVTSLALNAVEQGHSVCVYSGELPPDVFLDWILLQATESEYIDYKVDQRTGKNLCTVSPEIEKRIKEWLNGKMFLYDNGQVMEEKQDDSILKVFEACARRYGCKLFVTDNLMCALTSADEENKAQAKFMARLKAFATKYDVHVIVIAHPRKEKADAVFTNDSVSGSSVITNLADAVINVERPNLRITKNRYYGIQDFIPCTYDPCNRRIFQSNIGDKTVYSWDHTGVSKPEHPARLLPEFKLENSVTQAPANKFTLPT